jgi:hypothetical protein
VKTIENGTLINGVGIKKKLFSISAMVAILFLAPMLVIWASAQSPPTLSLNITATGDFSARARNCLQAASGAIVADLPPAPYQDKYTKKIGGVSSELTYSYDETLSLPLELVVDITIHIHIDGSFRKLDENVPVDITMLMIGGCTARPDLTGVQYCVNAYWEVSSDIGSIGTVTRTSPSTWYVDAEFLTSEQGSPSLCVNDWLEGNVVDGFCIPLKGFRVVVNGTITT